MPAFINTIDILGDDAVLDRIIDRSITEFKDDVITSLGQNALRNCSNLIHVDLPSVTAVGREAFAKCTALNYVNLPIANNISNMVFDHCSSLISITLPAATAITDYCFRSCTGLVSVDLSQVTNIYRAFSSCTSLVSLILRSETVVTLGNASAFEGNTPIASGTGYIYVPASLVDSYKAATNWSTHAAQFRALEDYTVDGTITGELNETMI